MLRVLLILVLSVGAQVSDQRGGDASDDAAVYRAIIAHTIQPQVNRFSTGSRIQLPAPVLAFNRTVATCASPPPPPPRTRIGCIRDEQIQLIVTPTEHMRRDLFGNLLTNAARRELAKAFRDRNRESRAFLGEASVEDSSRSRPETSTRPWRARRKERADSPASVHQRIRPTATQSSMRRTCAAGCAGMAGSSC
jgi:hypothetical protein